MADSFRPGDHKIISDRSGRTIWASEARKEWTGQIVHKDEWEPRQPQDAVRGLSDKMTVKDPRPRPVDTFIGPLISFLAEAAPAGTFNLTLESAVRMAAADRVHINLDNGETFRTTINSVTDATHIVLAAAMPGAAAIGNQVTDYTAMAEPDLP